VLSTPKTTLPNPSQLWYMQATGTDLLAFTSHEEEGEAGRHTATESLKTKA